MKKLLLTLIASATMLGVTNAQCGGELAQNCVGACAGTSSITYTVTAADVAASPGPNANICISGLSSSLCPNTDAVGSVTLNGKNRGTVDLENGTKSIKAKEGDVIVVNASLTPSNQSNVQCIWLGEVYYGIGLD